MFPATGWRAPRKRRGNGRGGQADIFWRHLRSGSALTSPPSEKESTDKENLSQTTDNPTGILIVAHRKKCLTPNTGVTPGTASAAIKHPFFGTWTSETTATVMAKRYRLWPCRNRPREGPETLAKIETLAMGFLATPKARSARSLARPLRPRLDTPSEHDRDAATRVPGTPSLAEGPRCRRGRLRIQAAPGERPSTRRCAAARDKTIIASETYRFRTSGLA